MSATLSSIGKQITLYGGTTVFIVGVVGNLLNILVFLSLRTFRQSSCAFYLTIMSIINICNLCVGLFSRLFTPLTAIDGFETSLFYCKYRLYLNQIFIGTSMTCWCLATIDQYFATCSRPHCQLWCNIKLAQRIIIISIILWILHGIPLLMLYDHALSSTTNKLTCTIANSVYEQYRTYFILLGLFGYIPITIAGIFGLMAFYNVRQMVYRTIPLVRRELDKQLTVMVLMQVVISIFTLLPYTTASALATNKSLTSDPAVQAQIQFTITVTVLFFYITFSSPFYIYICASERFRKQLIHVLFTYFFNRWKQPRTMPLNQVVPST